MARRRPPCIDEAIVSKSSRRPSGASATSSSPSGTARAGRRERSRYVAPQKSFLERHRAVLLGLALVLGLGLVGGFVFLSATSPTFACSTVWQAPSPDPDPDRLGSVQDDQGRNHVTLGEFVRYTYCPPASGNHVNLAGLGPIAARFYGPEDTAMPQGWIHNLEHGGMVVLYSCAGGCPPQADLDALRALTSSLPDSPVCGLSPGQVGPVIARFDQTDQRFAALIWGRVLYQETLDTAEIVDFFLTEAERTNPEPLCAAPSPSPAASPSPS
jgi:hypothetical protein